MSTEFNYSWVTARANGRLREIITPCRARASFDPSLPADKRPLLVDFKALWDTGATNTVICQRVVDALGLKPTGIAKVKGVHDQDWQERPTYLIDLEIMDGRVTIVDIKVTLGEFENEDIIIGMNIITLGDMAITNAGGKTMFSFRYPSLHEIDFANAPRPVLPPRLPGKPPKAFGHQKKRGK